MSIEIPYEFICPITQDIMKNPVRLSDNFNYEENAINEWLNINRISPITGLPITEQPIPNSQLQQDINNFLLINNLPIETMIRTSNINGKLDYKLIKIGDKVTVQLKPTIENAVRFPTTLLVLVDVSGSMDIIDQTNGNGEQNIYSRLDLVKHTLNALVDSLNTNDYLGIIEFADNAEVVHPITKIQDKQQLKTKISNLHTIGGTNLWAGIQKCLETFQNYRPETITTKGILVFTDGQSTTEPPRGIVETFKTQIDENGLVAPLNILGYGYENSISSKELYLLSKYGNGLFGYIPDFSMLGTVFINILSNILGSYPYDVSIGGKRISNIVLNQTKDIVVDTTDNNSLVIVDNNLVNFVEIPSFNSEFFLRAKSLGISTGNEFNNTIGNINNQLVKLLEEIQNNYKNSNSSLYVEQLTDFLGNQNSNDLLDIFISALMNDICSPDNSEGQIGKALGNIDWYNRWGRHYIFSIISSLNNQLCFSFKEKAPQVYNGHTFKIIQSQIEKAFLNLPAPTPSQYHGRNTNTNMTGYYNRSGGCISGFCKIQVVRNNDRIFLSVSEIRTGDIINGMEVDTIVRVKMDSWVEVVSLSDQLKITKYHPIRYLNYWRFPIDIVGKYYNGYKIALETRYFDYMYDIVFKNPTNNHRLLVDGWEIIGLGHGIQNDIVATHQYFGNGILKDIERLRQTMEIPTIIGFLRGKDNRIVGIFN